jgi:hypothetical protein
MKAIWPRTLFAIYLASFLTATAHAGTLSGTVVNRTTGKPAPDVDLTLLSPTQGMRILGSAKSDAEGRFVVTNDAIGMAPTLIRATYHDVSFNTFAPPGRPVVEVEIYDISKDSQSITVASHIVIFQPQGGKLIGAEEYEIQNNSQPPTAFFRADGNFNFAIPENSALGPVTTTSGETGMPVNQASIEKSKGHYGISYPFRPGQTNVRLSYELPYSNSSATLKLPAVYPGVKLLVVAPPGVNISGDGLAAAGREQGMIVYTHDPLAANAILSVSVSGQGSPAANAGDQGQGGPPQEGNSRIGPEVIAAPSRLNDFKWYLFAGLAALFAMGAILLSRKQVVVVGAAAEEPTSAPSNSAKAAKQKKSVPITAAASPPAGSAKATPSNSNAASAAAALDQHVSANMDSLKDQIFRLELRRQAGTISEEDYAREKAQVEKLLRDLVKG